MFEVTADPARVLPILQTFQSLNPVCRSIVEKRQKGRIFVDNSTSPSMALICSMATGFYFLTGSADSTWSGEGLRALLSDRIEHEAGWFGLLASSKGWESRIQRIFGQDTPTRTRIAFAFDRQRIERALAELPSAGNRVILIDRSVIEQYDELRTRLDGLWDSPEAFLKDGVGFCVVEDDRIASVCNAYSACVESGEVEVAVGTSEEFRGRGLATLVCVAMIEHCLGHGLLPQWSCHEDNAASIGLAENLGFRKTGTYSVFFPTME